MFSGFALLSTHKHGCWWLWSTTEWSLSVPGLVCSGIFKQLWEFCCDWQCSFNLLGKLVFERALTLKKHDLHLANLPKHCLRLSQSFFVFCFFLKKRTLENIGCVPGLATPTDGRHGCLAIHTGFSASHYPVSPLFHWLQHTARESVFGEGVWPASNSLCHLSWEQPIPPSLPNGTRSQYSSQGSLYLSDQTWLNTTQWLIQILSFFSVTWQKLWEEGTWIYQISHRDNEKKANSTVSPKQEPPDP